MTPNDKLLLDLLKHRGPKDADKFFDLVAMLLYAMRPDLIRYVASFGCLREVDNFVDEVIWAAFEKFRNQYLGNDVRMPFSDQHSDRVENLLKGWLLAMIGKPFARTQSGMITNAIRKQDAEDASRAYDDIEGSLQQNTSEYEEYFNVEEARANVAKVLSKLPAKKEFVFRIHTGLHDQEFLSPESIVQIARSSRLNESNCKYIKSIAKDLLHDGYKSFTLDQSKTGKLVAIGERQVRKIVFDVWAKIQSARLKPN